MEIGVISEGHADRAVITNLLSGILGIDTSSVKALRPIYTLDETDKSLLDEATFSTWSLVQKECEQRELIDGFLAFEGQDFIVIHIDTAEAGQYGIARPHKKSENYCEELRSLVIDRINTWLKDDLSASILYAVAIEEIDAWVLTIYDKSDSTTTITPKEKLSRTLGRKGINSSSTYDNFLDITKPFKKRKDITRGRFLSYNYSLRLFVEELETKVLPKLQEEE